MEFEWTNGRVLSEITVNPTDPNGTADVYSYTYDENGIRSSKTVNGTTTSFTTKDGVILSQTDGTNTMYFQYDNSGSPVGFRLNGTQYFYLTNQMGDVIGITDNAGTLIATYTYGAWGEVLAITPATANSSTQLAIANANPLRYRGYYLDHETGYYYLQSRYYSPNIQRFINADVCVELDEKTCFGYNLYEYCLSDPINYADQLGYGRIYVFYYVSKKKPLKTQAFNSPYYNSKDPNVKMIKVTYVRDFVKAWNKMPNSVDEIYLYLHGGYDKGDTGYGILYFWGEQMSFKNSVKNQNGEKKSTPFSVLKRKYVMNMIYLFSCYGGHGKYGKNVAWFFARLTNSTVWAFTGGVSYSKINGKYYPRNSVKAPGSNYYYSIKYSKGKAIPVRTG